MVDNSVSKKAYGYDEADAVNAANDYGLSSDNSGISTCADDDNDVLLCCCCSCSSAGGAGNTTKYEEIKL